MKPESRCYAEVHWEGAGRYAWHTRADGVQRWVRVGRPNTPLSQTLSIVAQRGLVGLTWAEMPEDLNASCIDDLTHADINPHGHDN